MPHADRFNNRCPHSQVILVSKYIAFLGGIMLPLILKKNEKYMQIDVYSPIISDFLRISGYSSKITCNRTSLRI